MRGAAVLLALAPLLAAAPSQAAPDAATLQRGQEVYARCAGCHAIQGNGTGPQHCGLFGRRSGTAPGYTGYSQAMRDARIVWDEKTLDVFLQDPAARVPGTAMGYAGVKDPKERADLLAWLKVASQPGRACTVVR